VSDKVAGLLSVGVVEEDGWVVPRQRWTCVDSDGWGADVVLYLDPTMSRQGGDTWGCGRPMGGDDWVHQRLKMEDNRSISIMQSKKLMCCEDEKHTIVV
jgi:hypothetical protein